jgi:hypothetical protein
MSTTSPSTSTWIESRTFDLAWVYGGALLSVAALIATVGLGASIVAVFWIWLLLFDAPHMAAAYTRTYLDSEVWRERRMLLLGSLGVFAVGPVTLALGAALSSPWPFTAFLGAVTTYSYYHVVRQHYGFVALYKAKSRDRDRLDFHLDKWALYIGCWAPYVYFLASHPKARALMGLVPDGRPPLALVAPLLVVSVLSPLAFVFTTVRHPAGGRSWQKLGYALTTLLLHDLVYFVAGAFEPVYAASTGPDTDFLLMGVMISTFHDVEYVAIVYSHNKRRYQAADGEGHGLAAIASGTALRYLFVCIAFAIPYFAFARTTGVFPGGGPFAGKAIGPVTWNQIALSLWWGLAIHHYVLDQSIWRIRKDEKLRRTLGVSGEASS